MRVETFTFLFTDVEGSTMMLRRLGEDAYGQVLADHHSVIRSALAAAAALGLACVAGDQGEWHRAGTLHGIAQGLLDRTGTSWEEFDARFRQESIDQARAHLGDAPFDRAYAQGVGLSPDDAVSLALQQDRPALCGTSSPAGARR